MLLVQFILAVIVTASVMPIVLVQAPAAREGPMGMSIAVAILVATFAVLWLVWPRRKTEPREH
jgi:hypothetical protein